MDMERLIVVREDDTAAYERAAVIPANNGTPAHRRVLETKRVAATALVPERGELFLLPLNCRFARAEEGVTVIVTEDAPCDGRPVQWVTRGDRYAAVRQQLLLSGLHHRWGEDSETFRQRLKEQTSFQLAFPYVVKCFQFSGDTLKCVTFWYRVGPLCSERDDLLIPNLPNRNKQEHYLCFGHMESRLRSGPIAEVIQAFELAFWGSVWNDHWVEGFLEAAAQFPEVASPWEWERKSREDPRFTLRIPWRSAERTIGQEVVRLLRADTRAQSAFEFFERRIRAADHWDAAPPATDTSARVSPAQWLVLGDTTVHVGDCLRVETASFDGCAPGTYAIEWFGRDDGAGRRLMKLVGISQPLSLIVDEQLVRGVVLAVVAENREAITLNGIALEPDAIIRFTDAGEWPYRECGVVHLVRYARRDRDGTVLVRLEDEDFFVAIGEGDCSFPGLTVSPKEDCDEDGFLRCNEVQLADGTIVRRGDRFYCYQYDNEYREFTVDQFIGFRSGNEGRSCLARGDGAMFALEAPIGCFNRRLVPIPATPIQEVRVGRVVVRIGDYCQLTHHGSRHQMEAFSPMLANETRFVLIENGRWCRLVVGGQFDTDIKMLPTPEFKPDGSLQLGGERYGRGQWYFDSQTKRVRQAAKYELTNEVTEHDVAVRFADGGREMFVYDYQRLNRWLPVAIRWRAEGIPIHRGQRLRLRAAVGYLPVGTALRVSHIRIGAVPSFPVVVTEQGLGFSLTAANAALFEKPVRGEWLPLGNGALAPATAVKPAVRPGEGLGVGVRVRYLGGDEGTNFDQETAKRTPAVIIGKEDVSSNRWSCRFDQAFAGLHWSVPFGCEEIPRDPLYRFIDGRHLVREDGARDLRVTGGFVQVFTPIRSKLLKPSGVFRMVNPGAVVGLDHRGRGVRVGDRVRVVGISPGNEDSTGTARELVRNRHIFTVVHAAANSSRWLYLDAGQDVGQKSRSGGNIVGLAEIPREFRDDPTWWSRLTWARDTDCGLAMNGGT
ncbi:MAG: hypothetical protein V1723_04740 [Candidatus Uhrbacteria bacterium]